MQSIYEIKIYASIPSIIYTRGLYSVTNTELKERYNIAI